MATINEIYSKINGRGIYLFKYGYEEVPSALMLFYNMSDLNNPNFDFKTAKPKNVVKEVSTFADEGHKVKWYEEDLKEKNVTATADAAAGTTTLQVDVDYLVPGDSLYNPATGETMLVTSVSGTSVTVDANNSGVSNGDVLVRNTYAKAYGVLDYSTYQRNDLQEVWNYVQYTMVDLNPDETDILANNMTRLFYNSAAEYLVQEVFARASRKMVKDMIMSLYTGKRATIAKAGLGTAYVTGGLDYFIQTYYPAGYGQNFRGATDKESIQNLRDIVTEAYKSGVPGLYANNRLILMVNTSMASKIDDLFMDKVVYLENNVSQFGINMKLLELNGRRITIVEDSVLNVLNPDQPVAYLVDMEGIGLFQVANDVVADNGRTVPKMAGVAKLFVSPQTTPEKRNVFLFGHYGWIFKNVTAGVYRKIIYA